jgi:sulfite exporter TauE/SafE
MDLSVINPGSVGVVAGFVAGLFSSAHCGAMCGPLACAASPSPLVKLDARPRRAPRRWREPTAYHLARVIAYAAVGGSLGVAGEGVRHALSDIAPVLPWVMAAVLVLSALGLHHRLAAPAALKRLLGVWMRRSAEFSPLVRAAAIGAATPLLPCAALYGLLLTAAATGSAFIGAGLMGAFALGATPALVLVQAHAPALRRHPRLALWVQRAVPLVAAAVLVWRAVHAGSASTPPSCH